MIALENVKLHYQILENKIEYSENSTEHAKSVDNLKMIRPTKSIDDKGDTGG